VKSSDYPHVVDGTQHACAIAKVPASAKRYKVKDALFLVPPCLDASCPPNPQYEQRLLDFWEKAPYVNGDQTNYMSIPIVAYVDGQPHAIMQTALCCTSERASSDRDAVAVCCCCHTASKWDDYNGGIYPSSECSSSGTALTHVVQIVGYGHLKGDPKKKFWLVRTHLTLLRQRG
jgi:hypothetical protein